MSRDSLAGLRRIRWAVRLVLVLGVAASVAANILHAEDNPVSETIAAWPPLALLLTVELISRVPVHRRSLALVRLGATGTIAGIAAWVSYWHMAGVAARYGETGAAPYLMPLSVDGLVVVASVSLVELAGRIRTAEQPDRTGTAAGTPGVPVRAAPGAGTNREVAGPYVPLDELLDDLDDSAVGPATGPTIERAVPAARTGSEQARYASDAAGSPASTGARTDAELRAILRDERAVPRNADGTVGIGRAAKVLGCGPDRARRLLVDEGLLADRRRTGTAAGRAGVPPIPAVPVSRANGTPVPELVA